MALGPDWTQPTLLTMELAAAIAACVGPQLPSWWTPLPQATDIQNSMAGPYGGRGLVGDAALAALHAAWLGGLLTETSGVFDGTAV
jgi:hypothetical protein